MDVEVQERERDWMGVLPSISHIYQDHEGYFKI